MDLDSRTLLANQAYHRSKSGDALITRYEKECKHIPVHLIERMDHLFRWFLSPLTLWPFNLEIFLGCLLDRCRSESLIDGPAELLLELLPPLPREEALSAVTAHEHDVQKGRYEPLIPVSNAKFAAKEKTLAARKDFQDDWLKITRKFKVTSYADSKGIIRRSLVSERNLRTPFDLDWTKPRQRFQAVFDTFCAKWNLYGIQNGRPLLQKLSVNLTPFGTMIFIPAYWSFDPKRDLAWSEITRLHKSRGQQRQGVALAESAEQQRRNTRKLEKLDAAAKQLKLRGARLHEFLCEGLGWDSRTDPKRLTALRKLIPLVTG